MYSVYKMTIMTPYSVLGKKVAHQAEDYPSFCSMKRLNIFLLPLNVILVHGRVTHSIKFAGTHLYTWAERDTVRV